MAVRARVDSLLGWRSACHLYGFNSSACGPGHLEECNEEAAQVFLVRCDEIAQLLLASDVDRAPLVCISVYHGRNLRRSFVSWLSAALPARFSVLTESPPRTAYFSGDLRTAAPRLGRWRGGVNCREWSALRPHVPLDRESATPCRLPFRDGSADVAAVAASCVASHLVHQPGLESVRGVCRRTDGQSRSLRQCSRIR